MYIQQFLGILWRLRGSSVINPNEDGTHLLLVFIGQDPQFLVKCSLLVGSMPCASVATIAIMFEVSTNKIFAYIYMCVCGFVCTLLLYVNKKRLSRHINIISIVMHLYFPDHRGLAPCHDPCLLQGVKLLRRHLGARSLRSGQQLAL